ncbi:hypothetical protein OpiT1DRAFT_04686 [Opitutaceae bacterium TAV1]|nr:hypothetical protein OpiT1DRAFT_04686 [Opitutaceae bacterium TAV1]
MNHDYIPHSDAAFNDWVRFLHSYATENATRLGVRAADLTALTPLLNAWGEAYEAALNPATRTPAAIAARNTARKALQAAARDFVKANLSTGNKAVTDADRENMGLTIPKTTHTPAPVPETSPRVRILMPEIRRLLLEFYDEAHPGGGKPFRVQGAEVIYAILDAPPASLAQLIRTAFDTRSPLTLDFEESERGKTVYFCLRWENTRGEKGPWSPIYSAIIP